MPELRKRPSNGAGDASETGRTDRARSVIAA